MAQSEIAEAASAALGQRIQPTYGYYRKRDGTIGLATITRLERLAYIERGWTHLSQYGAFDMAPYVASHPFEALFMFGGAKEMPVEQVIQMGFHLNPPLVPTCKQHITQYHRRHTPECWRGAPLAEFPQLAGLSATKLQPYPCEFCTRVLPTPEGRRQHQQVAHKDELGHLQAGRSLAGALNERPAAVPLTQPVLAVPDVTALLERIAKLEAETAAKAEKALVTCACGGTHTTNGANFHRKTKAHQAWAQTQTNQPEALSAPR